MTAALLRVTAFLGLIIGTAGFAAAQESPKVDERLQAMTRRAGLLKMRFPDEPDRPAPKLSESPLLRCSDPTREEVDGTVWLWAEGKRPVAALCIFYVRGQWNYEHTSLADEALEVTGRPDWTWQPPAAKRSWVTLDDRVPEMPPARQRALRALAGKLKASEVTRGQTYPLRLLPRPLYEYSDPEQGVTDGALFAFVTGTNPEIILQLEARQADRKRHWQASFARLSSSDITVQLDEKELWTVPAMRDWNPRNDYYSAHGKDPLE